MRNCLVALAERHKLAEVFDYRFEAPGDLNDHSVGDIIIAALADITGSFCEGVEQAARFLRIKGSVYPAATESLTLAVRHADGTVTRGESVVREVGKAVSKVEIDPPDAVAPPAVISAIEAADVVILSPGSLFTSVIPALLGGGVRETLARFPGSVVYAANAMTQPGETAGFTVSDHLLALEHHIGPVVTDVLIHTGDLAESVISCYHAEGASPVEVDRERIERLGVRLREADLLSERAASGVRHDPGRLADEVCDTALVRL